MSLLFKDLFHRCSPFAQTSNHIPLFLLDIHRATEHGYLWTGHRRPPRDLPMTYLRPVLINFLPCFVCIFWAMHALSLSFFLFFFLLMSFDRLNSKSLRHIACFLLRSSNIFTNFKPVHHTPFPFNATDSTEDRKGLDSIMNNILSRTLYTCPKCS